MRKTINNKLNSPKGFYFEDYEVSKYEGKSKKLEVKLSLKRLSFVFSVFLLVAIIFGSKIVYLASLKNDSHLSNKSSKVPGLVRQDIRDRNNNLLAKNVNVYSGGISPKLINNKGKLLINLRLNYMARQNQRNS